MNEQVFLLSTENPVQVTIDGPKTVKPEVSKDEIPPRIP